MKQKNALIFLAALGLALLAAYIFYFREGPPRLAYNDTIMPWPLSARLSLLLPHIVFLDNFESGNLNKYQAKNASIEARNGSLFLGADRTKGLLFTRMSFSNASYHMEISLAPDSDGGAGIVFLLDPNNTNKNYELILRNGEMILLKDGAEMEEWAISANLTKPTYLKIKFEGGGYSFWLDNKNIGVLNKPAYLEGNAGLVNYDPIPAKFTLFTVNKEN